ncbi:MAG: hypothetical protein AAGJ95_09525 [Cyanobacteria bacterium J06554_11]
MNSKPESGKSKDARVNFTAPSSDSGLFELAKEIIESEGWQAADFHRMLWVKGLHAYLNERTKQTPADADEG